MSLMNLIYSFRSPCSRQDRIWQCFLENILIFWTRSSSLNPLEISSLGALAWKDQSPFHARSRDQHKTNFSSSVICDIRSWIRRSTGNRQSSCPLSSLPFYSGLKLKTFVFNMATDPEAKIGVWMGFWALRIPAYMQKKKSLVKRITIKMWQI